MTSIVILLGLILNVKAKLIDSKLFKKLINEFGKDRLIDALIMLVKGLEVMDSKELLKRISMLSELQIDMRKEVIKLNKLYDFNTIVEKKSEIKLSKKQEKRLKKKVRKLIQIIDHKLEEEKIGRVTDFEKNVNKAIEHSKNIIEKYEIPLEEQAKKKLLELSK